MLCENYEHEVEAMTMIIDQVIFVTRLSRLCCLGLAAVLAISAACRMCRGFLFRILLGVEFRCLRFGAWAHVDRI